MNTKKILIETSIWVIKIVVLYFIIFGFVKADDSVRIALMLIALVALDRVTEGKLTERIEPEKERIDELESELEDAKQKVNELNSKIDELEEELTAIKKS